MRSASSKARCWNTHHTLASILRYSQKWKKDCNAILAASSAPLTSHGTPSAGFSSACIAMTQCQKLLRKNKFCRRPRGFVSAICLIVTSSDAVRSAGKVLWRAKYSLTSSSLCLIDVVKGVASDRGMQTVRDTRLAICHMERMYLRSESSYGG